MDFFNLSAESLNYHKIFITVCSMSKKKTILQFPLLKRNKKTIPITIFNQSCTITGLSFNQKHIDQSDKINNYL